MIKTATDEETKKKISKRVAELPGMDKVALLSVWNQVFPTPPPPGLRKQLMVPVLAYRIQEAEFGGLSQSARKRLGRPYRKEPSGAGQNGQSHEAI